MTLHSLCGAVLLACVWGVLDRRLPTRTAGTLALSIVGMWALVLFL